MKSPAKIATSIAFMASLYTGSPAQATAQQEKSTIERVFVPTKVKTETAMVEANERKGFSLQRTEIITDAFRIKYDFKPNLTKKEDNNDIAGFYIDKIIDEENTKLGTALLKVGNCDVRDETFIDAWTRITDNQITYGLEGGISIRELSTPRKFLIGTIENVKLTENYKVSSDIAFMTRDHLMDEENARYYGWLALYDKNFFASAGNEVKNTHVFAAVNDYEDFGEFAWYKKFRDTGKWFVKSRTAFEDVDKEFYSANSAISITRMFVIPTFFEPHFNPSMMRGAYTLGTDIEGDKTKTTVKLTPGIKTSIGYFGLGTSTRYENNSSTTGIVASYFNRFSALGIDGSVEVNWNGLTKQADAYIKMQKEM